MSIGLCCIAWYAHRSSVALLFGFYLCFVLFVYFKYYIDINCIQFMINSFVVFVALLDFNGRMTCTLLFAVWKLSILKHKIWPKKNRKSHHLPYHWQQPLHIMVYTIFSQQHTCLTIRRVKICWHHIHSALLCLYHERQTSGWNLVQNININIRIFFHSRF